MNRDEAIALLRGGEEGVFKWNAWRREGEALPALNDANLSRAALDGASLFRADLSGADLSHANLSDANLSGANLISADLSDANLLRADLSGAALSHAKLLLADLISADLHHADLSNANLRNADLINADLNNADLSNANLHHADLVGANLSDANLTAANLSRAALDGAKLLRANLSGADLSHAGTAWTVFGALDLSAVLGLATVHHSGPSTIGVDTLLASKGRIPAEFLIGCGLTQWEVLSARFYRPDIKPHEIAELQNKMFDARVSGPIGGVFISYAHKDEEFVDRLQGKLQGKDISVWRDVHDLVAGPIVPQVMSAVRMRDVVVVVLSEAALASDWVEHEVEAARERERKENRDILCPIALDDAWKKKDTPLWTKLRRDKVILAFDDQHDFDKEFPKLLKGMKLFYGPEGTVGGD